MNQQSSRSHAIFTITLKKCPRSGGPNSTTISQLHIVDLAGSERAKATNNSGKRFQESVHINGYQTVCICCLKLTQTPP